MNEPIHVLSVLDLSEQHLARLRAVSPRLIVQQHSIAFAQQRQPGAAELFAAALTPDTEILYTHTAPFDLNLAPKLRWVQVNSAGVDQLQNTPLWRSDIAITSANGVHAVQISEHVMAVMLAHAHNLPYAYHMQNEARWARGQESRPFTTTELRGKTLGILGYGAIGREIARLASAFGMRILATKRRDRPAAFDGWTTQGTGDADGSIPERFYDLDELPALLPQCDVVLLALPLSQQTRHIIDANTLALLPPHAFIVNIGRGPLIDTNALIAALREKRIGGAALDVTDPEPLPADSLLWHMDNVIITPHISGLSAYYNDRIVELFSENLRRYLNGEPLLNLVQRELGY